jgi:nitronate monooxygenase
MTQPIQTRFTQLLQCDYPIIAAPMFLVSNESMVVAASNAGAVGATPSLNWRPSANFDQALHTIRSQTTKPYAINLIVNKSNQRLEEDLTIVAAHKVPMVITSLGNPQKVIDVVHSYGGKVFCDVIDKAYALKVQDQGADGVIAVSSGAGGHAGNVSPMVLLPYLREALDIPIIAAGGIATGQQMLAALVLGADAVQIGTRFIASTEAQVAPEYKQAILDAEPHEIVMTSRLSGTPASVINTPDVQKMGLELSATEKFLRSNKYTGCYLKMLRYMLGSRALAKSAKQSGWKNVWSAGQGVGLVHDIMPTAEIVHALVSDYWKIKNGL